MSFKFEKHLEPEEVFEIWRQNEEHLEHWKEIYEKQGFESWEKWRLNHFANFEGAALAWYQVAVEPHKILHFRGGPFRGWKDQYYEGAIMPRFISIGGNPKIAEQPYIRYLSENFPEETTITGLLTDNGTMVYVIEGMHRCAAIALANQEGREIKSNIHLVLADYSSRRLQHMYDHL